MPIHLIIILSIFVLIFFYFTLRILLERQYPETTFYELRSETSSNSKLRILFFSDYHCSLNYLPLEHLLKTISIKNPDVVIFGGDMANGEKDKKTGQFVAARIAQFCRDKNIEYIAIRGNHDYQLQQNYTYTDTYSLLRNQHYLVQSSSGSNWQVIGLEDIRLGTVDYEKAVKSIHPKSPKYQNFQAQRENRIIIAHNPDSILKIPTNAAVLCLSGHFHGGQIKLFGIEYSMMRKEILCRCGFGEGMFPAKGMQHFISRGYGNVLFPFRLFSRPELTVIDVYENNPISNSSQTDEKIRAYLQHNPILY